MGFERSQPNGAQCRGGRRRANRTLPCKNARPQRVRTGETVEGALPNVRQPDAYTLEVANSPAHSNGEALTEAEINAEA